MSLLFSAIYAIYNVSILFSALYAKCSYCLVLYMQSVVTISSCDAQYHAYDDAITISCSYDDVSKTSCGYDDVVMI